MIDLSTHPVFNGINTLKKSGHLARFFIAKQYVKLFPRSKFVGITGSVGKTTAALAATSILSESMEVVSTTQTPHMLYNLDPVFNLPMTLLRARPSTKKVILELGIEYLGEMELYLSLVRPATAIVTKIYFAHSEFLGGLDEIIAEKGKLVEQLPEDGLAILNWDDLNTRKISEKTNAEVVYFGTDQKNCHVWAGHIRLENMQTIFELNYGVERIEIHSNLLGPHQVYPLLAAAALAISLGIPLINIKKGLEKIEPAEHRLQALSSHNGSIILDDSYNSSPTALEEALETLNQLPARRRIAVLGEMRELGKFSEKMHIRVAQKIFKDKIDLVLLGKGDTRYIADELRSLGFIPERLFDELTNPQIVSNLFKILSKGDIVLVKGSRATRLDEVVKRIVKERK